MPLARPAHPCRSLALMGLLVGLNAMSAAPLRAELVIAEHERLDFDRPESWAMRYAAAATLLGSLDAPGRTTPGSVSLSLEGGWIPSLSEAQRTVGFDGIKTEDLNKTAVFGRLRADIGLPGDLRLTLAVVPPLEVGGVDPRIFGLALARPLVTREHLALGLRLHGQSSRLEGDFTCAKEVADAGNDPVHNPFRCREASRDTLTARYVGLELQAAFPRGRFTPYLGLSLNAYDLELQVRAQYGTLVDRTRQTTHGTGPSLTVGATVDLAARWQLAGEAVWVPLDVVRPPKTKSERDDLLNVRGLLRWRWR
jgi:hypothetical protein